MPYSFDLPKPAFRNVTRKGPLFTLLTALALLLSSSGSSAQTWQRLIDYAPNDNYYGYEIVPTADGGFLVVLQNGYLIKFDAEADTLWTRALPDSLRYQREAQVSSDGMISLLVYSEGPDDYEDKTITLDNSGNIINVLDQNEYGNFYPLADGYVFGFAHYPSDTVIDLLRVNFAGDTIWQQQFNGPEKLINVVEVIRTIDGGFLFYCVEELVNSYAKRLIKTDAAGTILWSAIVPDAGLETFRCHLAEEPDGSIVIMDPEIGTLAFHAVRLSAVGEVLLTKTNYTFYAPTDFELAPDGGFWAIGEEKSGGLNQLYIRKFRQDFTVEWKRVFNFSDFGTTPRKIARLGAGSNSFVVLGGVAASSSASFDTPFIIHPDSLGNLAHNVISGQLRHDVNKNCNLETGEPGLANWLVSAGPYYRLTDSLGRFEMFADAGSTPVAVYPPLAYWQVCPGFDTVTFAQTGDTAFLDIPVSSVVECPYTEINITSVGIRPCFETTFFVNYCNLGTAAADSASALIVFPPELDFVSAGIPVFQQSGDSLWFNLGTLAPNECGNYQVKFLADCDSTLLGQTLCIEAYIFPDTICLPDTSWSGAEVKVTAQCINDQEVKLTIRNIGNAPTTPTLQYLIIEDQVVLYEGPFQLNPNDFLEFTEPADGSFWRISADQEANFPAPSMPTAWVEGCGGLEIPGLVDDYFFNDGASGVDIECRVVTSSFDPNDKQAFPEGYGAEHFIEPGTEITYLIRFQNTGTDTAFNVILRDTLDAWLDPSTLRPGAASHPYEFYVVGPGILKVWFKNILLPDSNVNEAASHGFFQYRVKMRPDIPLGRQIFNRAAIYFDFNAPVLTNRTFHTVGKDFYTVAVKDVSSAAGIKLTVAPNPFRETARFMVDGADTGPFELQVFDAAGRRVRREKFAGPELLFRRNGLPAGFYFFEVLLNGQRVASGKMIAE